MKKETKKQFLSIAGTAVITLGTSLTLFVSCNGNVNKPEDTFDNTPKTEQTTTSTSNEETKETEPTTEEINRVLNYLLKNDEKLHNEI